MRRISAIVFMAFTLIDLARDYPALGDDYIRKLQTEAIEANQAAFGHWGHDPQNYKLWSSHSNRLIPVYTFGTMNGPDQIDLRSYEWIKSPYRSEAELQRIYGRVPPETLNPKAEYFDQTNIFQIQQAALAAGKKHIFLVIFDGMDWQTTQAAAIYKTRRGEDTVCIFRTTLRMEQPSSASCVRVRTTTGPKSTSIGSRCGIQGELCLVVIPANLVGQTLGLPGAIFFTRFPRTPIKVFVMRTPIRPALLPA